MALIGCDPGVAEAGILTCCEKLPFTSVSALASRVVSKESVTDSLDPKPVPLTTIRLVGGALVFESATLGVDAAACPAQPPPDTPDGRPATHAVNVATKPKRRN